MAEVLRLGPPLVRPECPLVRRQLVGERVHSSSLAGGGGPIGRLRIHDGNVPDERQQQSSPQPDHQTSRFIISNIGRMPVPARYNNDASLSLPSPFPSLSLTPLS